MTEKQNWLEIADSCGAFFSLDREQDCRYCVHNALEGIDCECVCKMFYGPVPVIKPYIDEKRARRRAGQPALFMR